MHTTSMSRCKEKPIQMNSKSKIYLRMRRSANDSSHLMDSTSEPILDTISEPSPEGTSKPSPESESEPSPESESEPTPESESEPSPESESEPSPESESEPSPESESEPSPESESEPTPESESEPSPESESEPSPESISEPSPESISEPSPESESEPSPESESEPSPESESEPSPESESEPSPESESEPSPESESEPSPESESEPSPESEYEPSPESEYGPSPESESEPSPESEYEPSPESEYEPSPEGESEPSPESEYEPSPETTSEPSPESAFEPSPEGEVTSEPSPESESEPSPESEYEPSPESESEPSPETTSEPRPESAFEPSPEGEVTSEPNPTNTNSTSEPSPEDQVTSEAEPEAWPEPGPDWEKAYELWRSAWPAHTYLFAIIFLLMAFYSGYYIVVNVKDGLGKKYLSISLNVMMFLLSITRSFVLFLDPYHQGTLIQNKLTLQLMWSIGTPCLLASDSLCILALAESASLNLTHQRFQRLPNIVIVICLHFVLVIATDIVVSSHSSAKVMILYCQVFSITWGTLLGMWYFTLAHKINHVLFKAVGRRKSRADRIYLLLIYLSSAANLFTCVLILYSAAGVFGIYSEVEFVEAWPWYSLQTGMRMSEVIAAVLVFTVSAKRNRIKNKVQNVIVCGQKQDSKDLTDTYSTTPTVNNLYPASRNRRMSMFSAVHQSKISTHDIPCKDPTDSASQLQPPHMLMSGKMDNPATRGRRMSLFSQLHESKLTASHVAQRNPIQNQGLALKNGNSNVQATNEDTSLNGRRMSMFSQLQQMKLSANANSTPFILGSKVTSQSTTPSDENQNVRSGNGRRMSMFSQLQELKMSTNANTSISPGLKSKQTLRLHQSTESENEKHTIPLNKGRRMSMFSQLQELKMSSNGNSSLQSSVTSSIPNEKDDTNTRTSSILSRVHQFVVSHKKTPEKSEEFKENGNRWNFSSKLFHTKVTPVGSKSPKVGTKLNKIAGLCRAVETVTVKVHVNDTPRAYENEIDVGENVANVHDDMTNKPKEQADKTCMQINDVASVCESLRKSRQRSRTSLFQASTKLDGMKIIEDDEEEMETHVFHRRKSSCRKKSRTCSIDIDKNNKARIIPMQNMSSDSIPISTQGDQPPDADL